MPVTPIRSTSRPTWSTRSMLSSIRKFWKSTAIVITYDDSDGWYDHVMPPIINSSASVEDALTGTGHLRPRHARRRFRGSLRLQPAAAPARDLAIRAQELGRQLAHRHDLDPSVHRGQLVAATHRWWVLRCARGHHRRDVRLPPSEYDPADPQPIDGRARRLTLATANILLRERGASASRSPLHSGGQGPLTHRAMLVSSSLQM